MILQALFFQNCNGLQLSEMNHVNSGKNHISINACDNTVISNIQITAPEDSPNTSGIDISRSNNVLIQNSTIGTGNKLVLIHNHTFFFIFTSNNIYIYFFFNVGDDCITLYNGSSNINIVGVTCGPSLGIRLKKITFYIQSA